MKVSKKKQALNIQVRKVAVVILMSLGMGALFNTHGIQNWASRMEAGTGRSIVLALVEPLHTFAHSLFFDSPARNLRNMFLEYTGIEKDAGFQVAQETKNTEKPIAKTGVESEHITAAIDPVTLRKSTAYTKTNPLRVLFIGDSMIEGPIYVMFTRNVYKSKSIELSIKSRHSSGLTRPDYYNWPLELETVFANNKFDCVIVLLGTNDAQDMIIGGRTVPFNSKEWLSVYNSRTTSFISYLVGNVPEVYWIGLPKMKKPVFDSSMKIINEIHTNVCKRFERVRYLETSGLFVDKKGNYTDYMTTGKRIEYFRATDGIHLLYPAGKIIADILLDNLKNDFRIEAFDIEAHL
jgi:hypothetical protein